MYDNLHYQQLKAKAMTEEQRKRYRELRDYDQYDLLYGLEEEFAQLSKLVIEERNAEWDITQPGWRNETFDDVPF